MHSCKDDKIYFYFFNHRITLFFVFCLTTSMRVTCILLLSLVISEKTIFQTKYFNKIQSYFSFPPRITSWRPFSWSYEDIYTTSLYRWDLCRGREDTAGAVTVSVGEDTDAASGAGEITVTGKSGDEAKMSNTDWRDKDFVLKGSSRKTLLWISSSLFNSEWAQNQLCSNS